MKKLRIGIIGLGIGRHHIAGYQPHPQAAVVAIADLDEERLAEIGDQFGIENRYTDSAAMLVDEKLDLVSVCTPNKFHAPLTIAALEAGCHVLCEKPMAMNAAEARRMLDAGEQAGKRIMINFSYRFNSDARAVYDQVQAGMLGEIYFARTAWHRRRGMPGFGGWFGKKELSGGGPLIDLGVHRLDFALWMMGYPEPAWVMASTYDHLGSQIAREHNKQFDVEDLAVGLIKFTNGATLEVEASWAAHIAENELMETRLLGTRGGAIQRNRNGTYEFESEIYTDQGGWMTNLKPVRPADGENQNQFCHFVDAILNDRPHTATGEEGFVVMELLDAIYKSAASGRPVEISPK